MNLKGRDLLTVLDYTEEELRYIIDVAKNTNAEMEHMQNMIVLELYLAICNCNVEFAVK